MTPTAEGAVRGEPERSAPVHVGVASTFAGKVALRAGLLFLLFDLVVLGRVGFGGLFLLSACGVSALAVRLSLRGLSARVDLPREVPLARRFTVRVTLSGTSTARDVVLRTGGEAPARRVPVEAVFRLQPGVPTVRTFTLRLDRRGLHERFPLSLSTTWPASLFEARADFDLPCSVLVLPRVQRVRELRLGSLRGRAVRRRVRTVRSGAGDFRSLREFRSGDPVSRVHWRTSARHARLLLRELDEDRTPRFEVVLDPRIARSDSTRARTVFESGVTATASLVAHLLRQGGDVRLQVLAGQFSEELRGPRALTRGLRGLARVEPLEAGAEVEDVEPDLDGRFRVQFGSAHREEGVAARRAGLRRTPAGGWIIDAEARGSRELYAGRRRAGESPLLSALWSEVGA